MSMEHIDVDLRQPSTRRPMAPVGRGRRYVRRCRDPGGRNGNTVAGAPRGARMELRADAAERDTDPDRLRDARCWTSVPRQP